jgi:hypothetical protein
MEKLRMRSYPRKKSKQIDKTICQRSTQTKLLLCSNRFYYVCLHTKEITFLIALYKSLFLSQYSILRAKIGGKMSS